MEGLCNPHILGPFQACSLETAHRCSMQELERRYGALEEACTAKECESHRLMKAGSVSRERMVDARCLTPLRPWRTDTTRPQINSPSCIKESLAMSQTVGKPSSGRLLTWRSFKVHL